MKGGDSEMARLDYASKIAKVKEEIAKYEKKQEEIKDKIVTKKKYLEELENSQVLAELKSANVSIEELKELLNIKPSTGE